MTGKNLLLIGGGVAAGYGLYKAPADTRVEILKTTGVAALGGVLFIGGALTAWKSGDITAGGTISISAGTGMLGGSAAYGISRLIFKADSKKSFKIAMGLGITISVLSMLATMTGTNDKLNIQ